MTTDILTLKQRRAALYGMLSSMDASTPNADGQAQFNALSAQIEDLDAQIKRAEADEARKGASAIPAGGGRMLGNMDPLDRAGAAEARGLVFRTADGRQVRALAHGEAFPVQHNAAGAEPWSDDLSFGRLFKGMATGSWAGAEAERDYVSAMGATAVSGAGLLIPAPIAGRIIDRARAQARVLQAGALVVPMTTEAMTLASVEKDVEAHWKPTGKPAQSSDMAFGKMTLTSRTVMAYVPGIPLELIEDAANLGALVEASLARSIAEALDRAALLGSGIGAEPKGLYHSSRIPHLPVGAALDGYSKFSQAYGRLLDANLNDDPVTCLFNSRIATALDGFTDTTGQPLRPPPSWEQFAKLTTNQIPTEGDPQSTWAVMGAFANLLWGLRQDIRIELSTEGDTMKFTPEDEAETSNFRRLAVSMRAYARGDVGVARPMHFYVLDDIRV